FRQGMGDRFADGQALDALCSPLGRNLRARYAPDLLRVVLEEGAVQTIPEAVYEEVLECGLGFARRKPCLHVARADRCAVGESEIRQGTQAELQWIIEKPSPIEDARESRTHQHDAIGARGGPMGSVQRSALTLIGEHHAPVGADSVVGMRVR